MRYAFTMLELIIVIVVIGILAATVGPTFQRDANAEAAQQFVSHVRYTQHLAMMEDKFNPDPVLGTQWFRNRWRIIVRSGVYSIFNDADDNGLPDENEVAIDPLDSSKRLDGGFITNADAVTPSLNLVTEYGVALAFSGGCNGANPLIISFDHLGRPLLGDVKADVVAYPAGRLLSAACVVTFSGGSEADVNVTITPETGYVRMN
jgi:prepilin-type N-terminal cleavage/methylation domain-containing protein